MPSELDDRAPRRLPWLRSAIAALFGVVLLGLLLWRTGLDPIVERLAALGARGPLILIPCAVMAYFDTRGWRCTLPAAEQQKVPTAHLYFIRAGGESINSVLPGAAVGGEGVKAWLLATFGVSSSSAVASLVITKAALTVTQALFVVIGIGALFIRLGRPAAGAAWLAVLLAIFVAFAKGLVHLQRRGPAQAVWRLLNRFAPRAAIVTRLRDRAAAVDERLDRFYALERGAYWRSATWHMGGWLLGIPEVLLIMALIGSPVSFLDALLIESLSQVIRAASLIIPGGIGTQEIGGVALCRFLGVAEPAAVTFWLLRRARELTFDIVGAAYLLRWAGRRPSAN